MYACVLSPVCDVGKQPYRAALYPRKAEVCYHQLMSVSGLYAGGITWADILNNIVTTIGYTIFAVSAAAFIIGALMYVAGFISEENKSKGKNLMIGALFGMGIVLSAKAIFNTAYFFVYGV